jgi:DNA-binding transcriptional MerR regulator
MRELAEATGVSAGTVKHYLREGLLPEPVKTSRNMAYYPREFVERVKLIKQLQEERFLPLKVIKEILENGDEQGAARLRALVELEDRVLERALHGQDASGLSDAEVKERYALPDEVLERLERLAIVTPQVRDGDKRYGPDDVRIIEAVGRMRSSGYSESLGFTVYDALIYKRHLERLVSEEVAVMMERLAGEMDTDEAADLIARAAEPMRELVTALRAKLLISELKARRAAQRH